MTTPQSPQPSQPPRPPSPLQRLGRVLQQALRRTAQPTGRVEIGEKHPRGFTRIGQSVRYRDEPTPEQKAAGQPGTEHGGVGQFPTTQGTQRAIQQLGGGRLEVRVYGTLHKPYKPDEWGGEWQTFFIPGAELAAIMERHPTPFTLGHQGGYEQMSDAIMEASSLNFDEVRTVLIGRT